jgi:N-acetylglucosaminyl-diphospho-decaprenol L-rhamnosyltransferase
MNSSLDCTIVILSYNSSAVTDVCLGKVEAAVEYSAKILGNAVKIVVVDNGSVDDSVEMIRKKHPTVQLQALKKNIGYASGNNVAMKAAKTPYILLMNSDTYIEKDSLVKSFQYMASKSECDVVVSRWVPADGIFYKYGGYLPTPIRIILWAFGFESIPIIKNFIHCIYSYNSDFYDREGKMEWCPPCFFLLKKKVYELTDGFDEKLFFHMVDVEWCHRIRENKLTICYTPNIQVVHLGGASSKDIQHNLLRDNFKGLTHFCRKHYLESLRMVIFFLRIGLKIRARFYSIIGKAALAKIYSDIASDLHA